MTTKLLLVVIAFTYAEVIAVEHEHAGTKESENEQLLEVVEEEDMLPLVNAFG
jgi:hypothetical protein